MFMGISKEQKGFRDKIHREYNIIRGDKIVLVEDFFAAAVSPALIEGAELEKIYGPAARKIDDNLRALMLRKRRPAFGIPYCYLKDDAKARVKEKAKPEVEEQLQLMKRQTEDQARSFAMMMGVSEDEIFIKHVTPDDEIRRIITHNLLHSKGFVGAYLADIVAAMRMPKNIFGHDGVERFERASLRREQGKVALKFWQEVNRLHDYSDLFNDFPDLPSKRKKKVQPTKNPLWDWVPGAARPA